MSEPAPKPALWKRILPWLLTAACFAFLYQRIDAAAARQGSSIVPYLVEGLRNVSWGRWLAIMIPYSFFYSNLYSCGLKVLRLITIVTK